MKGKLWLGCTLAISIATNCFALEIYKGKLINQKEWTIGNDVKVTFSDTKKTNFNLKANQETHSEFDVSSDLGFTEGTVGMPVTISAAQTTVVNNTTNTTKSYLLSVELCVAIKDKTQRCSFYNKNIELEPTGYFVVAKESTMQLTFDHAGSYMTHFQAKVLDDLGGEWNGYSSSETANIVLISDSNFKHEGV